MEETRERLQVVGDDDERAGDHEHGDPGIHDDSSDNSDRDRAADRQGREDNEDARRDASAQRPTPELVEGMRSDSDGEPEGDEGGPQA